MKVSDEFVVGKNNIGWIDSSFIPEFGSDQFEKGNVLSSNKFERNMYDTDIIKEFSVQECTLGDVLETINAATNDMKDGYANLFYIKGHPSRVVSVDWVDGGWHVGVWDRDYGGWSRGLRVFSPATGSGEISSQPSESGILESLIARVEKLEAWKKSVQEK